MNFHFLDLDPNIRVLVSDEWGNSIKRAEGSGERRELSFRPVPGRRYFLSLLFGAGMHDNNTTFVMRMSTVGFKKPKPPPPRN